MAKILTTKGSAAELETIIRKAEKEIFLISYSYIISDAFITRLKQAIDKDIVVNLVYGAYVKPPEAYEQIKKMANIKVLHTENLHAKIFANETTCLIGSMNFSEASEIRNTELGVLLTLQDDKEAFNDAIDHCKEIVRYADVARPIMPKSILDENKRTGWNQPVKEDDEPLGYCIRTRKRIPLNHSYPYSDDAYEKWLDKGGVDSYGEKYDHFTGEESDRETTYAHPVLSKNWKKYKEVREKYSSFKIEW